MSNFGKMLILVGVRIVNQNGSYRNLGDIMNDLSAVWINLSVEQRDIISEAFNQEVV